MVSVLGSCETVQNICLRGCEARSTARTMLVRLQFDSTPAAHPKKTHTHVAATVLKFLFYVLLNQIVKWHLFIVEHVKGLQENIIITFLERLCCFSNKLLHLRCDSCTLSCNLLVQASLVEPMCLKAWCLVMSDATWHKYKTSKFGQNGQTVKQVNITSNIFWSGHIKDFLDDWPPQTHHHRLVLKQDLNCIILSWASYTAMLTPGTCTFNMINAYWGQHCKTLFVNCKLQTKFQYSHK